MGRGRGHSDLTGVRPTNFLPDASNENLPELCPERFDLPLNLHGPTERVLGFCHLLLTDKIFSTAVIWALIHLSEHFAQPGCRTRGRISNCAFEAQVRRKMDMRISWRGSGFGEQGVFAKLEKRVRYVKACALPGSRSALLRIPVRSERRGGWTGTVACRWFFAGIQP